MPEQFCTTIARSHIYKCMYISNKTVHHRCSGFYFFFVRSFVSSLFSVYWCLPRGVRKVYMLVRSDRSLISHWGAWPRVGNHFSICHSSHLCPKHTCPTWMVLVLQLPTLWKWLRENLRNVVQSLPWDIFWWGNTEIRGRFPIQLFSHAVIVPFGIYNFLLPCMSVRFIEFLMCN